MGGLGGPVGVVELQLHSWLQYYKLPRSWILALLANAGTVVHGLTGCCNKLKSRGKGSLQINAWGLSHTSVQARDHTQTIHCSAATAHCCHTTSTPPHMHQMLCSCRCNTRCCHDMRPVSRMQHTLLQGMHKNAGVVWLSSSTHSHCMCCEPGHAPAATNPQAVASRLHPGKQCRCSSTWLSMLPALAVVLLLLLLLLLLYCREVHCLPMREVPLLW